MALADVWLVSMAPILTEIRAAWLAQLVRHAILQPVTAPHAMQALPSVIILAPTVPMALTQLAELQLPVQTVQLLAPHA